MSLTRYLRPFRGADHEIVSQHEELTGEMKIKSGFFRDRVLFEVITIVTVDQSTRWAPPIIEEYIQNRKWIRA